MFGQCKLFSTGTISFKCILHSDYSSFFSVIVFIMIASTAYDIIRTKQESEYVRLYNSLLCQCACSFFFDYLEPKIELLIAFSVYTNTSKIMTCNRVKSPSEISCLHAFRSISMCWVVTSHLYDQHWYMPFANTDHIFEVIESLIT